MKTIDELILEEIFRKMGEIDKKIEELDKKIEALKYSIQSVEDVVKFEQRHKNCDERCSDERFSQ